MTKQENLDLMGEHLFDCYDEFLSTNQIENAEAIRSEWIVDGRDPEDGSYQFMFINDLTMI